MQVVFVPIPAVALQPSFGYRPYEFAPRGKEKVFGGSMLESLCSV